MVEVQLLEERPPTHPGGALMPFEARELPTAVEVGGEFVAGPFCRHCGYPFTLHSPELLCPVRPNIVLGPICDCHEVQEIEVTRWQADPYSTRRTKAGRPYRRRVTRRELRIVRR